MPPKYPRFFVHVSEEVITVVWIVDGPDKARFKLLRTGEILNSVRGEDAFLRPQIYKEIPAAEAFLII